MNQIFLTILQMNLTATVVILAVFLIRLLLKRAPKIFSYVLWLIVLFRLVCPVALESSVGIQINSAQITSNIVNGITLNNQERNDLTSEQNVTTDNNTDVEQNYQNQVNPQEANTGQMLTAIQQSSTQNPIMVSPFFQIMKSIWLGGIAVLLVYSFFSYVRLKRKLTHAKRLEHNLFEMEQLPTPFVFGVRKPQIYLPTGINGEEREYILAHERMHIKRFDYLIKIIAFLVVIVHWINPLVWFSFLCMTRDMEMSCDEAVIRKYGLEIKKGYSSSLLHMAVQKRDLGIAPLAFGERNVEGRIKNVLSYKKAGVGILIVCVCVLIGTVVVLTTNQKDSGNKVGNLITEETGQDVELSETDSFPTWLSQLYEWRTSYIGDNSAVGNITDLWETSTETPLIKDGFELQTNSEPYELTIHYNSDVDTQTSLQNNNVYLQRNAVLFFALVENAGKVNYIINDEEVLSYTREELEEIYGDLWKSSESYDSFCELYQYLGYIQDSAGTNKTGFTG